MSGAARLRFVNEWVGGLVLGSAVVFLAFFILAGKAQGWFEKDFELRTVFPPQGALDLQKGAEVRIQGAIAGRVGDIVPNELGALQTTYILRGRFRDLVRTNSIAIIKKKFQVVGEPFVEITPGDRRFAQMQNEALIPTIEDVQVIEKLTQALEDVRVTVVPMLEEVQGILANVNGILTSVHEGKGLVGTLLNDEQLSARVHSISTDFEASAKKIPVLVEQINKVAEQMNALTENASRKVDEADLKSIVDETKKTLEESRALMQTVSAKIDDTDLRPALLETEAALRETRRTLENLQHHWLFRGPNKPPTAEEAGALSDPMALPIPEVTP
jgi:ABC-type transporter Mla subunit MlaD